MTNTFEGTDFVNQNTGATANATQYALDLFPGFDPAQADKVGEIYADLGTPLFQENAIQGECRYPLNHFREYSSKTNPQRFLFVLHTSFFMPSVGGPSRCARKEIAHSQNLFHAPRPSLRFRQDYTRTMSRITGPHFRHRRSKTRTLSTHLRRALRRSPSRLTPT